MSVPKKSHQMHVYRDHVGYLQPNQPNGTRRGLIPGPVNMPTCLYPLSPAHANISIQFFIPSSSPALALRINFRALDDHT